MLCILHLLKMLYSSNLSLSDSSGKILECTLSLLWHYPSLIFPYEIYKLVGKNSSSGPSLGNISHVHEWERQHGEGCPRRSRFLVKCEWHSLWYLTLVAGAVSLSDQGRRLHESWYLYEESSGSARHLLLIAKRNDNFYVGQIYWCSVEWNGHDLKGMQHGL